MYRNFSTIDRKFGFVLLVFCLTVSCSRARRQPTGAEGIQELLTAVRTGKNDRVRVAAIRKLGTRQESSAASALIAALQDSSLQVRNAAVTALRSSSDPTAKEALLSAAKDPAQSRDFQLAAASALAHMHDARAADLLIEALPYAAPKASASLIELGGAALDPLVNALHRADIREPVSRILASMGSMAVEPLIRLLHGDYDKYARLAAATTLGEIDDPRAAQTLRELLKVPNLELVAAVYRFLIRQGNPGTEEQLIAALHTYGSPAMAEDFLLSGSAALKTAAENWASETGFFLGGRTSELPQVHWASILPRH
jgi:HEAT repeat protein